MVNDTAGRGVKLFQDYNLALSRNEKGTQKILQVVEANRKVVPTQQKICGEGTGYSCLNNMLDRGHKSYHLTVHLA